MYELKLAHASTANKLKQINKNDVKLWITLAVHHVYFIFLYFIFLLPFFRSVSLVSDAIFIWDCTYMCADEKLCNDQKPTRCLLRQPWKFADMMRATLDVHIS